MNMRDIPWLAVLAVTLLVGSPVFAQKSGKAAAPLNEQRIALVIGNSAYKDSPLANPVNDAADMAQALQNAGFKVILKRNANTRDMRQAIREFANELRRAQVGLFYFAGHGVQVKGANYLVPVGADIQSEADAEDLSIDTNYVLRTMEEAQTKVSIVILDACRNNPYARSFRSTSRGLAQMTAATGSIVAFATAPGSVAADGTGRNGIYTKHLLESLHQPDTDILRVFQRTRAAVVKETGGKQTPWESTSLTGDFYFRSGTQVASVRPSATPVESGVSPLAVELAFWNTINSSTNAADFQDYLNRFPDGQFAGLAKNRLDALRAPPVQTTPIAPPSMKQGRLPSCPGSYSAATWTNCVGEVTFPNGAKYVGEFRDGKPNGQGTGTLPDGQNYVGEFRDGKPNGQGTLTYYKGEFAGQNYVGEVKDGKPNGQGTLTYYKGEFAGQNYVGEFKDGKRHGQGTYTWPDGRKYVGEYSDNKPNGQGTGTLPSGEKYVGEWRDAKFNGQGTQYRADGTILQSGIWENGVFARDR